MFRNNCEANIEFFKFELSSRLQNFTVFDKFSSDDQFDILQSIFTQTYDKYCPGLSKTLYKNIQATLDN